MQLSLEDDGIYEYDVEELGEDMGKFDYYEGDFPKTKNNVSEQKKEFVNILDTLKNIGINTVVVQVRPKADALYQSNINPWSDVLTGTQGKYPGYDPLEFMIKEAHSRGMELHAWLNPYRVTTSGTDLSKLAENHPARKNSDMVFEYNNALYYDPASKKVQEHIADTVKEIVQNYKVDAIHFDDYFYPDKYPLPPGEGKDGPVANQRRQNVNDMVSLVSKTIKQTNPNVQFGISPIGIWKNGYPDKTGSNTTGNESYYAVYADTRTWIQNEWIDYVVPQIYWEIGNKAADYATLVEWWSNEVKNTNVKLYIGQGIYKEEVAREIDTQLQLNTKYPEIKGSIFFTTKDILNNLEDLGLIGVIRDGLKTKIYFIPDNPENNQNDKPKLKKNLKFKDSNLEESEDDIWSEFWNIVEKINKNYKGIKPEDIKFATKKQLYSIAKTLLTTENFIGNTVDYNNIQYLIFRKIKYSNQRINLVGAVQYIRKVINDQVQRYRNGELKIPFLTPVKQSIANFTQRDTDYNSIENELLGWT